MNIVVKWPNVLDQQLCFHFKKGLGHYKSIYMLCLRLVEILNNPLNTLQKQQWTPVKNEWPNTSITFLGLQTSNSVQWLFFFFWSDGRKWTSTSIHFNGIKKGKWYHLIMWLHLLFHCKEVLRLLGKETDSFIKDFKVKFPLTSVGCYHAYMNKAKFLLLTRWYFHCCEWTVEIPTEFCN